MDRFISQLVQKYMDLLSINGEPPEIRIVNNLGSRWVGLCEWRPSRPETTTIYLQKAILGDERTLERVLAHEMIHHGEALDMTDADRVKIKFGIKPVAHGESFRRGSDLVNSVMGDDFVTETSDKEYVTSNERSYFVLIMKGPRDSLGWAWASKLSPQMKAKITEEEQRGGRLVMTTERRWSKGTKIAKYGGMSLPRGEDTAALAELFSSEA